MTANKWYVAVTLLFSLAFSSLTMAQAPITITLSGTQHLGMTHAM